MKTKLPILLMILALMTASCGGRRLRIAEDITPGNYFYTKLDWRYGSGDIRIQLYKLCSVLMNNWQTKIGYDAFYKPRIVITDIDNCTDEYISTEMIRDILEEIAVNDGRFTVVAGDRCDRAELDAWMDRILNDSKFDNSSRIKPSGAIAPQFLAKVRITKAIASDRCYDYQDYRMTVNLYDIETGCAIDSASDLLRKRIRS